MACSVKRAGCRRGGKARFSPQLPTQPDTLSFTPAVQQYRIRYCIRLSVRPSMQEYYTYNASPVVCVPSRFPDCP